MSKTLGIWMTMFLIVNFMFAPILAYKDSQERKAVETVLIEGAKRASIEGQFTPTIIDEMKATLVDEYNFKEESITITATTTPTPRYEYLEASIEVPRGIIFIVDIFNQGPDTFYDDISIMSEKL